MARYGQVAHHGILAANAGVDERSDFIRKTYIHLGFAILSFVGLSYVLVNSPLAPRMLAFVSRGRFTWLMILGGFMVVGWIADYWARSATSPAMQYMGLGLYVVAEAFLFLPLLFIAAYYTDSTVLPTAGILTGMTFGGLTLIAFVTKKDFSFMKRVLSMGMFAAMGIIVCAIMFDFSLGLIFSGAMVLLASGYILFYTSNVIHHYPVGSHVAASLALFSAVALLFWYILQIVMSLARD